MSRRRLIPPIKVLTSMKRKDMSPKTRTYLKIG